MKILFVGPIDEGQTSRMRMEALRELGHTITPLNSQSGWENTSWVSRRLQYQFAAGPTIKRLNQDLLRLAQESKPDLCWAEKQEYLYPETLRVLHRKGTKLLHFTPDPYFSLSWKQTRLMNVCMPLYDYVLTSKMYELDEYQRVSKNVIYMPLGYSESVHRPLVPSDLRLREKYTSDVAFVGGWEPRRMKLLEAIIKETGCNLKIWGLGWGAFVDGRWTLRRSFALKQAAGNLRFAISRHPILAKVVQGGEIYADAYAWAVAGARISVGFIRHVCPDQHTTRTFEIPACGSMLLADRTQEHTEFFVEDEEAVFFSSKEELVEKVKFYLAHEDLRKRIAMNGLIKCRTAGYSYKNRLAVALKQIGELA